MKVFENFGKYVLLERVAAGGMAEVYLAKSTGASGISKFVAIKRILPQYSDNPEFIDMFKEEAKIAVNLNHSNVVSIMDFGVEKSQFFLVMEYVEGQNLRQILNHLKKEQKKFSTDQIVYMIKEVAAGLDHAHRCLDGATGRPLNITHRDMSPQNIMVSFEGEIKVVDFGIAKAESQMEHTRAGTIKGKFGYMSPEQADGHTVDLRTDIFSLATVLWELLAQDRLFTSNSEAGTLRKIRECQIPSLRKIDPTIPPELERICNKGLAKDKSLRYQTAAAFHRDLNRFLNTQYPEFSPHDFSVFMKSSFSQMFLENRKKLVDYSKVQGIQMDNERTMVTTTSTVTESTGVGQNVGGAESLDNEIDVNLKTAAKVNLGEFKTKDKALDKGGGKGFSLSSPQIKVHEANRSGTQTSYRKPLPQQTDHTSNFLMFVLFVALAGGGGYWFMKNKRGEEREIATVKVENTNASSAAVPTAAVQKYAVSIESDPSGARIYIDGQDVGMITPARINVEANREFRLGLKRDGYNYYEKIERAAFDAYSVKATLLNNQPMGYISINVMNGGNDTVILINGQRLGEKLPITRYAVPANTLIKVEAYNPFTKLSTKQNISVGQSEKKQLNLILSREGRVENNP